MLIFKLVSLILLLAMTIYITKKYSFVFQHTRASTYIFGVGLFCLLLLFILRFSFLSFIAQSPFLIQTVVIASAVYMSVVILSFLYFILGDIIHFYQRKSTKKTKIFTQKRYASLCLILSFILSFYGVYHAKQILVTRYDYTIQKDTTIDHLNVIFISDLHLGTSIHQAELKQIYEQIKELNPDIILYGGDIFDENTTEEQLQMVVPYFQSVHPRYGSYYVYGNHEFYTESQTRYNTVLKEANIHILRDQSILIDNAFTIIGRLDIRKNTERKSLTSLVREIDTTKPVILLDHQPIVEENAGIDIQLSGHTHNGQIVPLNFFMQFAYPHFNGFYHQPYPMIVTSGAGTWGIPMRIGTHSEIVYLQLTFQK